MGDQILQNGFRPGRHCCCGGAIYFFGNPKLPKSKLGPDSHTGAVLEAAVDMGRMGHLDHRCHGGASTEIREKYDSVTFNPGDGDEYIVWDNSRVVSVRPYDRYAEEERRRREKEEERQRRQLQSGQCCWLYVSCGYC